MQDEMKLLIQLIKGNKSLNDISGILGLSNKQLFMKLSMLRNYGYQFDREYKYDGEIHYSFHNPFVQAINTTNIKVQKDISQIRAVLIADTHIGSKTDKLQNIDGMTNYCIENGINIVLHCGDFFQGIYNNEAKSRFKSVEEQISYGIREYPYDKNILTFTLLGNHAATFWKESEIDIQNILLDRRHDLIPIGYNCADLNIGKYKFTLKHPISNMQMFEETDNRIILLGHSHKFSINCTHNHLNIRIPSLNCDQNALVKK